jgi:hypothetical protein
MFCSFGQVFSHGLGVGHVKIFVGTNLHFRLNENPLGMELGLHGFDDGIFGLVLGLHTHMEQLIILI